MTVGIVQLEKSFFSSSVTTSAPSSVTTIAGDITIEQGLVKEFSMEFIKLTLYKGISLWTD